MTHIAVWDGHNVKSRIILHQGCDTPETTLFSMCIAHKKTYRSVFLEFEDGLYYPLNDDQSTGMACAMVAMSHKRHNDEDGWIQEAHAMETATQDHMVESSSESDDERGVYDDNDDEPM